MTDPRPVHNISSPQRITTMKKQTVVTAWMVAGILALAICPGISLAYTDAQNDAMAKGIVEEAASNGRLHLIQIPQNKKEEAAYSEACQKGPREFFGLLHKGDPEGEIDASQLEKTWRKYSGLETEKKSQAYCQALIRYYREAKDKNGK